MISGYEAVLRDVCGRGPASVPAVASRQVLPIRTLRSGARAYATGVAAQEVSS